ncbi:MAG: flagellar biosynthetic protein FliR [Hyphomonadaceae bacterium]
MDQLTQYAWIGALVFARLGSVIMLAPGWGENATPARFRLAAGVLITAILAPALASKAPPMPPSTGGVIALVAMEVLTGIILGVGARLLFSAVQVAGAIMGLASGLGFAQQVDPLMNQTSAIFSAFLSLMGVVLVMATGLHNVLIAGVASSYDLFPVGGFPPIGDSVEFVTDTVATAFTLGLQIAAPVLIFSVVFNIGLGFASRLIPQVQMYLVAMPASVLLGTAVIALGLGGGLMVWLAAMEREVRLFGAT